MTALYINISTQRLHLMSYENIQHTWPVSTSRFGVGEVENSQKTPRGWHYVRAIIGKDLPERTVFVSRRPTGEQYSSALAAQYPDRDWILSRILWLCGSEKGRNRFGKVDTMRRYIYIHGTPDTEPMGTPASHGCIRMRTGDIVALCQLIQPGIKVLITGEACGG